MATQRPWRRAPLMFGLAALVASCSVAVDIPESLTATSGPEVEQVETELPETELPEPELTEPAETEPAETEPESGDEADTAFGFPVSNEWPESFRDYVDFVQETRGEEFALVADVRFADPDDLVAEFQRELFSFDDLDAETQAIVLRLDDMYRALGLANVEFNLLDANRDVVGGIAAFYDWQAGEIVFPSPGGGYLDEIPLRDQPILVHELGHALQAERRIAWANRMDDPALGSAMLEGEAEWLFDRYVQQFTDSEWRAWNDSLPPAPESSDLPEILEIEFAQSYVLGARFFHAQHGVGGLDAVDAVFEANYDAVSAQMLLDPWLFNGRMADQETFDYELAPSRGGGAYVDVAYDFPTSAVNWHQILAAALPGDVALRAARGINSYTLPTGWTDVSDRFCFAIEASASPGHEVIVEEALRAWAEVEGVRRWFEITDRGFYVGGCDPGPGNVPAPRATPSEILGEVAYVLDTETWAVEQGLDPRAGFCAGWDLVRLVATSTDDELDTAYYAWFDALDVTTLSTDC